MVAIRPGSDAGLFWGPADQVLDGRAPTISRAPSFQTNQIIICMCYTACMMSVNLCVCHVTKHLFSYQIDMNMKSFTEK